MPWPLSQDYNEAIQSPQTSFADPELRGGQTALNVMGLPMPCSGNFADVYRVHCPATKHTWAVKCFTREIPGLRERYREISSFLQPLKLPFMVGFTFLDKGICVHGNWYPVLKMEWAEGAPFNLFVRDHLDKPQVLEKLCQIWVRLAGRMREANFAHCDLQHGNVLLVPGTKTGSLGVKLVDYDGMCVPSLTMLKALEVGHPSYQHPQRQRDGIYNLEVDRFSHLVIYTALRSLLIGGRDLWDRYDNGDNLLFCQADFKAPAASNLLSELRGFGDSDVRRLANCVVFSTQQSPDRAALLTDLVPDSQPFLAQPVDKPAATPKAMPHLPHVPKKQVAASVSRGAAGVAAAANLSDLKGSRTWLLGGAFVLSLFVAALIVVGAAGLFAAKSPEGILVIKVNRPSPDVYVDGEKFNVSWSDDGKTGEARLVAGTHQVELKKGIEGFREEVEIQAGTRTLLPAKLASKVAQVPVKIGKEQKNDPIPPPPTPTDVEDPLITEMKFVKVPKGTFWMGWDSEKKQSEQVTIENDFKIAAYTVTQGQWEAVMGSNPSHFSRQGGGKNAVKDISDEDLKRFPVERVSWNDIQEFLEKFNERAKGKGWRYRLPTSAEWEYACRGAATSKEECSYDFYVGEPTNDLSSTEANFNDGNPLRNRAKGPYLGRTTKVGSYPSNKLGLFDMHGNVCQWCLDLYPGEASARVLRGGSWAYDAKICRSADRYRFVPDLRNSNFGFRLVAVPFGVNIGRGQRSDPIPPTPRPIDVEDSLISEMKFATVPKGTFWMGWESEKKQSEQVTIENDFKIAAYTVTQGQWGAVMGSNPSHFSRQGFGKDAVKDISDVDLKRFPVEGVSWNDIQAFLEKVNKRVKGKGWTYRLPTSAEWEYACRGAATSKEECSFDFYVGKPSNDLSSTQANFNGDYPAGNGAKGPYLGRTTKVGSYASNKLGLYDMHGNVWQWCQDLYPGSPSARVLRGGSWDDYGRNCQAGYRPGFEPDYRSRSIGFRLVAAPAVGAK